MISLSGSSIVRHRLSPQAVRFAEIQRGADLRQRALYVSCHLGTIGASRCLFGNVGTSSSLSTSPSAKVRACAKPPPTNARFGSRSASDGLAATKILDSGRGRLSVEPSAKRVVRRVQPGSTATADIAPRRLALFEPRDCSFSNLALAPGSGGS